MFSSKRILWQIISLVVVATVLASCTATATQDPGAATVHTAPVKIITSSV